MGSHGHGGGNLSKELKKDPIAMQTSSPWVSGLWDAAAVDHSEKWTVDFVCGQTQPFLDTERAQGKDPPTKAIIEGWPR